MHTSTSSASSSLAGESPRLRRARASISLSDPPAGSSISRGEPLATIPNTPNRRLTMTMPRVPKIPSFLSLSSPKKLSQQHSVPLHEPKDKNEPSRFLGDGVSFKAKLIGILEVGEARGDRMCQEALADLKMAIRAAGEHKQRITINIAIDGLRLRDEKTMDCLYHHPVHKISFIAQDMTDSRAFGYIFGSPDTGHRFFGIKTDKAAGQVVVAMRDLFQVVFELKKKEIELAKLQIEQQQQFKNAAGKSVESLVGNKNDSSGTEASGISSKSRSTREELRENGCISTLKKREQQTSEVIADLLDLEIELNSIQQGIHQMEKITPSDPFGPDAVKEATSSSFHDPFEDSFSPPAVPTTAKSSSTSHTHPVLLPPPPSSTRADLLNTSERQGRGASKRNAVASLNLETTPFSPSNVTTPNSASASAYTFTWFDFQSDPLFGDNDLPINLAAGNNSLSTVSTTASTTAAATSSMQTSLKKEQSEAEPEAGSNQFDVFTELDPLGTGKSRPYVDKKNFFQELKNPPKKVLKDLAVEPKDNDSAALFSATFESSASSKPLTSSGYSRVMHSPPIPNIPPIASHSSDIVALDPFAENDPFGESAPFVYENIPDSTSSFPSDGTDPFDTCFADFTMFGNQQSDKKGNATNVYHGPLRVSLPPEKAASSLLPPPPTSRRSSPIPSVKPKSPRLNKQLSATAATPLVRLPSPKSVHGKSARRLAKQITLCETKSTSMLHSPPSPLRNVADDERLSSSSLELTDIAPEPPPRPAASKPPPLPPKRQQQTGLALRPPPRPPPTEQYDYINNHNETEESTSPPLPIPVRRPRSRGSEIPRPRHQSSVEFTTFSLPPPPAPVSREEKKLKSTGVAANLTLKQLTKMNISELATSLNVSPGHLSKMTLQELAHFLASVSADNNFQTSSEQKEVFDNNVRKEYSALRESVDDETFKADFESHFTDLPFVTKSSEDVFQEAPFDKYAVFRELVEKEVGTAEVSTEAKPEDNVELQEDLERRTEGQEVQTENESILERSDSAMAEEGRRPGEEDDEEEEEEEEEFGDADAGPDKYAALRDICSEPQLPEEDSEKEDSVTEANGEKTEEDFNLLTLSRQQSESPDSPVQEITNVRESQSIIESTILEEDIISDTGSNDEKPSVDTPLAKSITPSKLSNETSPASKSPDVTKTPERIAPPTELQLPVHEKITEEEEKWAKFDDGNFDSIEYSNRSEELVSHWSLKGREFPAAKVYRESPEAINPRPRRKYGPRRESPSHDDDDDEELEEWEGRGHRENGWRGTRPTKRSPWGRAPSYRTSPSDYDDDVEEYDDVIYKSRPPPRASSSERRSRRPPSWDNDENDHDDHRHTRRVVGWVGSQQECDRCRDYEDKRDRSGSRGEYIERRHWDREEEESGKGRRNISKYPAGYATWGERGSRKATQECRNRESAMYRKQYESHYWHYRDQRPSIEYEYDDPDNYDLRYKAKKTGAWPKRPSSASDVRKASRRGFQSPSSSHSHDADQLEENFSERRFRNTSSDQSRGWRNDTHDFNSDQETDYIEKVRDSYEQRSHTLHSRRNQRQKRGTRVPNDDFFSPQQKSPFEDDFSTHSFHATEFSSIESPAESNRKQDITRRKDSQLSEPELKLPSSSPMSEIRDRESPSSHNKTSVSSSRRQSPFEDDFTLPEIRRSSGRVPSSISSDVSEHRRSPHDETSTPNRVNTHSLTATRSGSLAVDDVFLPTTSNEPLERESESLDSKVFEPRKSKRHAYSEESTSRSSAHGTSVISVLKSTDSNLNIKKSESVNIFARDHDPFDDDFFGTSHEHSRSHVSQDKSKNTSGSFSKWSETFEDFDFTEED